MKSRPLRSPFSRVPHPLWLFALLMLCLLNRPVAAAEEPNQIDAFKKEYPAAAAKLEQAYRHVHIVSTEARTSGGKDLWTERVEFRRNGKAIRKDRSVLKSNDPQWPVGGVAFGGTDGTSGFYMFRIPGEQDFTFLEEQRYRDGDASLGITCSPCFAAYTARTLKLSVELFAKGTHIASVQRALREGIEVIDVKTESDAPKELGVIFSQFSFQARSYALLDWTISTPTQAPRALTGALSGHNEYVPNSDPPKLTKVDQWIGNARSARWEGFENRIERVDFVPVEMREFTPAAAIASVDPQAAARYVRAHGHPTTRTAAGPGLRASDQAQD